MVVVFQGIDSASASSSLLNHRLARTSTPRSSAIGKDRCCPEFFPSAYAWRAACSNAGAASARSVSRWSLMVIANGASALPRILGSAAATTASCSAVAAALRL